MDEPRIEVSFILAPGFEADAGDAEESSSYRTWVVDEHHSATDYPGAGPGFWDDAGEWREIGPDDRGDE